jgi:transposase
MTDDLLGLADWLAVEGVTHVAMESTGVSWKAPFNLLEGQFEVLLANAQHIKTVPGGKTDVKDAEWIADLLRHGLLRASFVPDRPQRELRELTRYRTALVRERAAEANRLQKTLEGANIKLVSVATNVLGRSARHMLEGLVAGNADPPRLAQFARGRIREKIPQLERALAGHFAAHQRFIVAQQLAHMDYLDEAIECVSTEVAERLARFEATIERLDVVPGVGRRTAEILLSEIGTDMSRFPTAAHLASWECMCPGHHESAGKQHDGKTRKGSLWLRQALIEAASAAGKTKGTYLAAHTTGWSGAAAGTRPLLPSVTRSWLSSGIFSNMIVRTSTFAPPTSTSATAPPLSTAWSNASNSSVTSCASIVPPPDGGERLFQSRPCWPGSGRTCLVFRRRIGVGHGLTPGASDRGMPKRWGGPNWRTFADGGREGRRCLASGMASSGRAPVGDQCRVGRG